MGSVSGIVAAPCVGPVLLAILAVAANSGDVAWSAILLFTYSLSMGVPFLLLGTFSGLISKLPKAGAWLGVIKFITAVALLMVVQYLAWPFVKRHVDLSFSLSISVISTVFFGGLFLAWIAYRFNLRYLKLIAACAVALCVSPAAITERPSMDLVWNSTLEAALEQGQSRNTVTMVDLYADWCAACKELDHKTFTDPVVRMQLAEFSLARLDLTIPNDYTQSIQEQYQVAGLPCVLFIDSSGKEIAGSRLTGFLEPHQFLSHIQNKVMG